MSLGVKSGVGVMAVGVGVDKNGDLVVGVGVGEGGGPDVGVADGRP